MKTSRLQKRRVFYLSGFDPRGARHYHQLYASEAQKQSALNGGAFSVGPRSKTTAHFSSWPVHATWENHTVTCEYEFLGWDDLVRRQWQKNTAAILLRSVSFYITFLWTVGAKTVRSLSHNAFLTGILPLLLLVLLPSIALVCGFGLFKSLASLPIGSTAAGCVGAALAALLLFGSFRLLERLGFLWLLRTYAYMDRWSKESFPELHERIEAMADHILARHAAAPAEETLIIGHSVGSIVAVCVVARVLAKSATPTPGATNPQDLSGFHFLTLGNCIPLLSLMPRAADFRSRLAALAHDPRIPWSDVSAPPDPLCFFQTNPFQVSRIACARAGYPRLCAARVFRMFTPATYRGLRWNKVRIHFQYLMAAELATGYDFFLLTAGPRPVEETLPE